MTDPIPIGVRRALIGPRTETLHIKVSKETAEFYDQLAHKVDSSRNDVCATVLETRAHGKAVVERLAAVRIEIMSSWYPQNSEERSEK